MSSIDVPLRNGGFGKTMRKDAWWVEPLLIFLGYAAFILYANYAVLPAGYWWDTLFPALAIASLVTAVNLVTDSVEQVANG